MCGQVTRPRSHSKSPINAFDKSVRVDRNPYSIAKGEVTGRIPVQVGKAPCWASEGEAWDPPQGAGLGDTGP